MAIEKRKQLCVAINVWVENSQFASTLAYRAFIQSQCGLIARLFQPNGKDRLPILVTW
jgi:hypothetical protein